MKKVVIIAKGCPLCGSDVYGNEDLRYLCRKCYILFERRHLRPKTFLGNKILGK